MEAQQKCYECGEVHDERDMKLYHCTGELSAYTLFFCQKCWEKRLLEGSIKA